MAGTEALGRASSDLIPGGPWRTWMVASSRPSTVYETFMPPMADWTMSWTSGPLQLRVVQQDFGDQVAQGRFQGVPKGSRRLGRLGSIRRLRAVGRPGFRNCQGHGHEQPRER